MENKKGISAKAFGAQAFHADDMEFRNDERTWTGPKVGDTTTVDRWVNGRWEEWTLVWDGERYVRSDNA